METFVAPRALVDNPAFGQQRADALAQLEIAELDAPVADLIKGMATFPYCFTLQSCYGHFLFDDHLDRGNLERLPASTSDSPVEYRIAYLALCVDRTSQGIALLRELNSLTQIDPDYVQFGCATWFWRQHVNSYAFQVEPKRYKTRDSVRVGYQEALRLQRVRDTVFSELARIVDSRLREL
jgi:hypothetical protein